MATGIEDKARCSACGQLIVRAFARRPPARPGSTIAEGAAGSPSSLHATRRLGRGPGDRASDRAGSRGPAWAGGFGQRYGAGGRRFCFSSRKARGTIMAADRGRDCNPKNRARKKSRDGLSGGAANIGHPERIPARSAPMCGADPAIVVAVGRPRADLVGARRVRTRISKGPLINVWAGPAPPLDGLRPGRIFRSDWALVVRRAPDSAVGLRLILALQRHGVRPGRPRALHHPMLHGAQLCRYALHGRGRFGGELRLSSTRHGFARRPAAARRFLIVHHDARSAFGKAGGKCPRPLQPNEQHTG